MVCSCRAIFHNLIHLNKNHHWFLQVGFDALAFSDEGFNYLWLDL